MKLAFLLLVAFGIESSNANPVLRVKKQVAPDGRAQLCVTEFANSSTPECFTLQNFVPQELDSFSPLAKFTEIKVTEIGTDRSGADAKFIVAVEWAGLSGGTLSFAGPRGRTFALGQVEDSKIFISRLVDAEFLQRFDRSIVFNENDSADLDRATLVWLNDILTPVLEAYFNRNVELAPKN